MDQKTACKYGSKCYQRNSEHLNKYTHPPSLKRESKDNDGNKVKKQKQDIPSIVGVVKTDEMKKDANTANQTNMTANQKKEQISDNSDSDSSSSFLEEKNTGNLRTASKDAISDSDSTSPLHKNHSPQCEKQISDTDSSCLPLGKDENLIIPAAKIDKELGFTSSSKGKSESPSTCIDNTELRERIKDMFLVEMPDDFFEFWEFCKSLSKVNPEDALKSVGLSLVGPYDVMAGKFNNYKPKDSSLYLIHWRYYYDPPEFQTVLKGDDKTQFHIGYFRDDPKEPPCFLASNCAAKDCVIIPMAENIFGAVNSYLTTIAKACSPFQKMKVTSIQKALLSWAKDLRYDTSSVTSAMKTRRSKVVTKSFHGAGIVVPVAKKTDLGYRELIETDAKLKKILSAIVESKTDKDRDLNLEKLQPIITAANIANDECDFGTSLELGMDLFSFGGEVLQRSALQLLKTAYMLLRRHEFSKIIEAHLENRKKGANLSIIK